MTLAQQFNSFKKYGYITDTDNLPPRQWADGKMHEKKGGEWFVVVEENKPKGVAAKLRDEFTENTKKYLDKDFSNKTTGIKARFSKESQKEIKSRVNNSKENGFTIQEHFEVANQIKELFENATLEKEHADTKHNEKNVRIERFLSQPVKLKTGKVVRACITVKHSLDKDGRNIYSLEAMDIKNALEKTRAKGQPKDSVCPLTNTLTHDTAEVKSLSEMFLQLKRL